MKCKNPDCGCTEYMAKFCKFKNVKSKKKTTRKPKSKNLIPIPKLDALVWELTSLAYRLEDADSLGYCNCATCGKKMYYYGTKECHMGHFQSRRFKSTKFLRKNQASQCNICNGPMCNGRNYEMGIYLNKKYGEGTAEEMIRLSNIPLKMDRTHYKVLIFSMANIIYQQSKSKKLFDWKESITKWKLNLINSIVEETITIDDEIILGKYRIN